MQSSMWIKVDEPDAIQLVQKNVFQAEVDEPDAGPRSKDQ
jgi:hypothetical protein